MKTIYLLENYADYMEAQPSASDLVGGTPRPTLPNEAMLQIVRKSIASDSTASFVVVELVRGGDFTFELPFKDFVAQVFNFHGVLISCLDNIPSGKYPA